MDFTTAEKERERLSAQRNAGQITNEAYTAAVNALRVTDAAGTWWQPDPTGPGWLVWNGSAWGPGVPPKKSGLQPGTPKTFVEFQSRLMTVDEFKKMSKEVPLAKRPQKWWDLLSILGGTASAILWLLYSGIREGFDFLTPLLMIAIPVCMIWFREDLDVMLLPLQPRRRDVNKLLLVGIGMAFPFLTAFILFNLGVRNYPLIQWNMIIGTFGAYAITRNPVIRMPGMEALPGSGKPPIPAAHGILVVLLAAVASFLIMPVRADDCTRDILNAQDCLRTGGYAEGISGIASSAVSTSVNGQEIVRTLSTGGTSGTPPSPPPAQTPQSTQPATPADQAGTAGQTTGQAQTGQPATPSDAAGTAGQATGTTQTPGTSPPPTTPADQASTAGQATGQSPTGQTSTPADTAGTAGQATGTTQTPGTSTPPTTPADQAGTAGQAPGTSPAATTTTQPTTPTGPAGSSATATTQPQGPDSLPVNPDDAQNIKEAIDDIRKENVGIAAGAAAATAAVGAGAAASTVNPPTPPGIDPNTGRRILTPEQQARREQILKEMAASQAEAEAWSSYADKLDTAVTVLETVEKTADIAIDVGSTLSPGAGGRIKNIYAATKTITKNMSEGYATDKGLWEGFKKGAVEAATDKALDVFAGQVTDKFGGKVPGFGKFESPADDLGDMSLSAIRNRLKKPVDTGDIVQDIRSAITHNETGQAVKNAVKNAVQGQVQSASLWDPFKKFFGVSS